MLSDLTVERKGFVPAPSRPRSTSIADFVANPNPNLTRQYMYAIPTN